MEMLENFSQHVLLYSKGWYGKGNSIMGDLKILLGKYAAIDPNTIPDRDIIEVICHTIKDCLEENAFKPWQLHDLIFEMSGYKWQGFSLTERKIEEILIGKLSVVSGELVNKDELLDIKFSIDK